MAHPGWIDCSAPTALHLRCPSLPFPPSRQALGQETPQAPSSRVATRIRAPSSRVAKRIRAPSPQVFQLRKSVIGAAFPCSARGSSCRRGEALEVSDGAQALGEVQRAREASDEASQERLHGTIAMLLQGSHRWIGAVGDAEAPDICLRVERQTDMAQEETNTCEERKRTALVACYVLR